MNESSRVPEPRLTWREFSEICPVARSDRRSHAVVFDRLGLGDDVKDDEKFFPALLDRIRNDREFLIDFNALFWHSRNQRDHRKSFVMRIGRWLGGRVGIDVADIASADPDLFAGDLIAQEFVPLFLACWFHGPDEMASAAHEALADEDDTAAAVDAETTPAGLEESDPTTASGTDVGLDWSDHHRRVREMLASLTSPDPVIAAALLDAVQALHDACVEAARRAAEDRSLEEARAGLRARLASFPGGPVLETALAACDLADEERLAAMIEAIDELDRAYAELESRRAAFAEAKKELDAALVQNAYGRLAILGPLCSDADNDFRAAEAAYLTAADGLLAASGEAGATEEHESDVEDPSLDLRGDAPAPALTDPTSAGEGSDLEEDAPGLPFLEAASEVAVSAPDLDHKRAAPGVAAPIVQSRDSAARDQEHASDDAERDAAAKSEPPGPSAEDVERETETPPAVWTGRRTLEEVLAEYLLDREHVLAWRLMELVEERGLEAPVPSAALRALAMSEHVSGPHDGTAQTLGEALAAAVSAAADLEQLDDEQITERTRAFVFAALLRPALLSPDTTAREHLRNLQLAECLQPYGPLRVAVGDLGFDIRLDAEDLAQLAGVSRSLRVPERETALREWLDQARNARGMHQPTYAILHRLVAPAGVIGKVVEAALAREDGCDAAVGKLLSDVEGDAAQERLIADTEEEIGRPKKDRIKGTALDWAKRKLDEGCVRLRAWLEARQADRAVMDDRRRATLRSQLGVVRKAASKIDAGRDDTDEPVLDRAVRKVVAAAVADLEVLLDGRGGRESSPRPEDAMALPLLRLPGGCQDYAPIVEFEAFSEEDAARRQRLFNALLEPNASLSRTLDDAFERRLRDGALLAARRIAELLRPQGRIGARPMDEVDQVLEERLRGLRREARARVETLRLELATLYNLDLKTGDAVRQWIDRLEAIQDALTPGSGDDGDRPLIPATDGFRHPDIPPDFPELTAILESAQRFAGSVRETIRGGQRERLARLAEERPSDANSLRTILETLEKRDLITVEDMIAQLQANRSVSDDVGDDDNVFRSFFPGFVETVDAAADDLKNRGRLDAALRNGIAFGPVDFRHLDSDGRSSAEKLLVAWRRAGNALGGSPTKMREATRDLAEALGFTSAKVSGDAPLLSGRLIRLDLRTDPLAAVGGFLPPVFGSEALGAYPVFLARSDVPDDQLAVELAKVGREKPCLLLVFGFLSRQRRQNFARRMRQEKQSVLLVDETLALFMAIRTTHRIETLVTCASPFGYVQPYTTNSGSIPREMFFGRREEIEKIVSRRSDGCLVYGGRQLGKSALLSHVQKLYDSPERAFRVLYLKIDVIGGMEAPAAQIWREVGAALAGAGIGRKGQQQSDEVVDAVRAWLEVDPGRRVLLLLDESDVFLAAEARARFPNLVRLKDLMEATERRFKVVFAGLHNVRRMAQAPNSPLVHLGVPICVGPLNTSSENSAEARRLVTQPMQAAGYDYADPALPWDILARVNHYPSLVQVFCKALLEGLASHRQVAGEGPRWSLTRGQIFEGGYAREIQAQIRDRFQWTLNLDPRYELIAKVLALYRFNRSDGNEIVLRRGLTASELRKEVMTLWPPLLEPLGESDFSAFLDEMEDLGVLARYGRRRDRFGLRSAQVAQMLGHKEDLESQILQIHDREPGVDYDAAEFHQRVALKNPRRRSPLSDRGLEVLLNHRVPGPRVLAAAPGLWGNDVAERIAELADGWQSESGPMEARVHSGSVASLRKLMDGGRGRRRVIVLADSDDADDRLLEGLASQSPVRLGTVIPILVRDGAWLARQRLSGSSLRLARVLTPRPWGEAMLRVWLADNGLDHLDLPQLRAMISLGSGGAPERLAKAAPVLDAAAVAADPDDALQRWCADQRITAEEVGLPDVLQGSFASIAALAGEAPGGLPPDEVASLQALMEDSAGPEAVGFGDVIRIMSDLGLIRPGEPSLSGVALTPLGRLLARSTGAS